jgi:hypothetical protein
MFKFIEPFYFFISLFIGMFFVYILAPIPDIIIKYPLPNDVNNIIYKDENDMCYKYDVKAVDCDKNDIHEFDIQYVDNNSKNNKNILDTISQKIYN